MHCRVRMAALVAVLFAASGVAAEDAPQEGAPAPLPWAQATPEADNNAAMMTTHDASPPVMGAPAPLSTKKSPARFQGTMPFGRAEPSGPVIPSAPHATVAVPVVGVDELEAPEAAPPTPLDPEADPVQSDPAEPTELTSPIFETPEGVLPPRTIVLRALNKVTAQSAVLRLKPNETVRFGQMEITAVLCLVSSPASQTDYAALLDISEKLSTKEEKKPLFRGWMYASSPSVTALEHPVYDVSMVECSVMPAAPKKAEKPSEAAAIKRDKAPGKSKKR